MLLGAAPVGRAQSTDDLRQQIETLETRLASLEIAAIGLAPCGAIEDSCAASCDPTCSIALPVDCGAGAPDCGATCPPCGCCDLSRIVGYDDGFYVRTPDQATQFKLNVAIQANYIANWRNPAPVGQDDFESGFTLHRCALVGAGTAFSPQLNYFMVLQPINSGGSEHVEEAKVYYEFASGALLQFGRFRDPSFLRELDVAFIGQLGMERSYVHSIFSTGILEGMAFNQQTESLRAYFIVHDGRGGGGPGRGVDFTTDRTDVALSTSLDWKVFGEWAQYGDFASWPDEPWALFFGGGYLWEEGETGDNDPANNLNNL